MQEGSLVMCIKRQSGPWEDDFGIINAVRAKPKGIYVVDSVEVGNDGTMGLTLRELGTYYGIWDGVILPCLHAASRFEELLPPLCIPESLFNQSLEKITI